jgi:cell division protein FtsQ
MLRNPLGKKSPQTLSFLQPNRLNKRFRNQAKRKVSLRHQLDEIWQHHAVSIQRGLFWLRRIVWIALSLGSIAAFTAWLLDPQTLPILELQVAGNQQTTLAQLQRTITPFATGSFFQVDAARVRQQVLTLPWVKTAAVKKVWSHTLRITLVEYQAVARWDADTFVDDTAKLFVLPKAEQQNVQNLPNFTGKEDNVNDILVNYLHWQSVLQSVALDIREIGCNARQAWYIILNNKIKLLLGRDEGDVRIQRFAHFYPRSKLVPPALVDLRYRSGIAVHAP